MSFWLEGSSITLKWGLQFRMHFKCPQHWCLLSLLMLKMSYPFAGVMTTKIHKCWEPISPYQSRTWELVFFHVEIPVCSLSANKNFVMTFIYISKIFIIWMWYVTGFRFFPIFYITIWPNILMINSKILFHYRKKNWENISVNIKKNTVVWILSYELLFI